MARIAADEHPVVHTGEVSLNARLQELEHKVDHLLIALASQRLIGTAVGLMAHQHNCSTSQAWDLLARVSQDTNLKVRDLARVLVDSQDGVARPTDDELLARLTGRTTRGVVPEETCLCPSTASS